MLHQCIEVVRGDRVIDVIPCVLDDKLSIVCLKYNKGLHYDPIVAGCLDDDLSHSWVFEPQCGAEEGESEPGEPEDAPLGNHAISGLKSQEDAEGEPPRKHLPVDSPSGILKRPAGMPTRPAAVEFGEGAIVIAQFPQQRSRGFLMIFLAL